MTVRRWNSLPAPLRNDKYRPIPHSFCETMPVITIRMAEGRTLEQKRVLADEITAAVTRTFGVDPEIVTIFFEELKTENIARAGKLLSEP